MIEVEIKLPLKDPVKTAQDLITLGFEKGETITEEDLYFDNADSAIRRAGEALRVRNVFRPAKGSCFPLERETVITFKGKKLDQVSMTRQELETGIEDPAVAVEIFRALGYEIVPPGVSKKRTEYHRNSMTACLDTVRNLGSFLELEMMVPEDCSQAGEKRTEMIREEALDQIAEVLEKMGYSMEDTTRTSYLSMLQNVTDD